MNPYDYSITTFTQGSFKQGDFFESPSVYIMVVGHVFGAILLPTPAKAQKSGLQSPEVTINGTWPIGLSNPGNECWHSQQPLGTQRGGLKTGPLHPTDRKEESPHST